MYCTGGIRCDIYSAYLRQKGFQNLYTLEGGVANYLRELGMGAWKGSLFTFDDRLAVSSGRILVWPRMHWVMRQSHANWTQGKAAFADVYARLLSVMPS